MKIFKFSGGKIETGESKEDCLRREIKEELNIDIIIHSALTMVKLHYADFSLQLYPFVCSLKSGELKSIWVDGDQLRDYDWAES